MFRGLARIAATIRATDGMFGWYYWRYQQATADNIRLSA